MFCVVVQSLSCVQLFVNPWTIARQASLSFTLSQSFLKLIPIESMMPSNHLILCHLLLLLPSIFLIISVFFNELALCIRWPKCWSFSFNISPSNEHPGLIYLRMDWLDLLAVQGRTSCVSTPAVKLWHEFHTFRRTTSCVSVLNVKLQDELHTFRSSMGCSDWSFIMIVGA